MNVGTIVEPSMLKVRAQARHLGEVEESLPPSSPRATRS
jgi:hypothetical protein